MPACLPASATTRELTAAGRRPDQRRDAVLRTCQHRSGPPLRRLATQRRTVRVERARSDELVGIFERRLEEQSDTGQVAHAVHGAEGDLRVWGAPEHVFVWCADRRMEPRQAGRRDGVPRHFLAS